MNPTTMNPTTMNPTTMNPTTGSSPVRTRRPRSARRPRALFVLGVPRSGTTLIGNYLGSAPDVLNFAEYGGFYVAHSMVPAVIQRIPGFHHDAYLTEVREHARTFAERLAREHECAWYVDHTPWNLEVAGLAADPPDALFVLMLRHYSGNILSLRRFPWAGETWEDTAQLWVTLTSLTIELPADRLIPVSYDALAEEPGETLASLGAALESHGFGTRDLDQRLLAVSHAAVVGEPRPTIGTFDGGEFRSLQPIRSFDSERWSGDIQARIWPIVRDMHYELLRRFPGAYRCPPPPRSLRIHDDIGGLLPYELDGW
jgi:sulfotransferase family protein